jgi:hypothetical protein
MICPKCGEKYEDDMPRCLWCDASNPVEERNPAGDDSPKEESQEKEDECITFESKRDHDGAFEIARQHVCSILILCLGLFLFRTDDMFCLVFSLFFVIGAPFIFLNARFSAKVVHKVKCYKDRFVLCTCYDEMAFSFDKANRPEMKISVFDGYNTIVFQNSQYRKTFIVCERDFPEVVVAMKRVYGISAE